MCLKRIIALLFACVSVIDISAQSNYASIHVINDFSQTLIEYSQTKNLGECGPKFDNLCHERVKCRVENDLIKNIAERAHSIPKTDGTYLFDTYVNEITKMIDSGWHITIENIEYDSEMSTLGLVEGKADYVKYDIAVSGNLSTENRYTDIAVIRDGKITAIYQYAGARSYLAAVKMLLPDLNNMEQLDISVLDIDFSKAEFVFSQLRKIASSGYGDIATKSMGLMVAMEMANIGCDHIDRYVRKIDQANYFIYNTRCPDIHKGGARDFWLSGIKDFEYIIGPGETLATWNFCKEHPYVYEYGSAYFHFIYSRYRPLTNTNLPYIRKDGDFYGFISENGKKIIDYKYNFAYPFDVQSSLSAVRDINNKWGFIDCTGRTVIPHIYDIVNDVFIDGKNFVIKDDYLILINTHGEELRRIYGYNYIIPKLRENEIIAYNGIEQQFDAYDFYGNLLLEDCFSEENMSLHTRFRWYHDVEWHHATYNVRDDINGEMELIHLPRIPRKISSYDVTSGDAIDLGTGVLWASKNLGASSCYDMGKLYLWGDYKSEFANVEMTRAKGEKFKKKILKYGVPINIAGTYLDIVTRTLGAEWSLPTKEDLRKLAEECVWEYCILNGSKGYRVTGDNGNSIFLPIEGEFFYEPYAVQSGVAYVLYWSSELASSDAPYGLQISQYEHWLRKGIELSYWNYIRPVRDL